LDRLWLFHKSRNDQKRSERLDVHAVLDERCETFAKSHLRPRLRKERITVII